MKTYNLGMIGYGYWGKIIYRYFHQHPGFNVTHIATRHPQNITGDFKTQVKLCTPDEVINSGDIDVVAVATPISKHYDYIIQALEKGKHVYSEKPLTLTEKKAENIMKLAKEKGRFVFTDYIFTFSPAIKKMISLVKEGAIGKIHGCSFNVRQLGHFGNSVYWDLASHILSIIDMLFPLEKLEFTRKDIFTRKGVTETGMLYFKGACEQYKHVNGNLAVSFNHPVKERNMTLYGDKGTLIYDMMKSRPLLMALYKVNTTASRDPIDREINYYDFDEFNTLQAVVQGFYDTLTGKIPHNLEMAVKVTGLLEKLAR